MTGQRIQAANAVIVLDGAGMRIERTKAIARAVVRGERPITRIVASEVVGVRLERPTLAKQGRLQVHVVSGTHAPKPVPLDPYTFLWRKYAEVFAQLAARPEQQAALNRERGVRPAADVMTDPSVASDEAAAATEVANAQLPQRSARARRSFLDRARGWQMQLEQFQLLVQLLFWPALIAGLLFLAARDVLEVV